MFQSGEELFGLPVHTFDELQRTSDELDLLSSLYDLYLKVRLNSQCFVIGYDWRAHGEYLYSFPFLSGHSENGCLCGDQMGGVQ